MYTASQISINWIKQNFIISKSARIKSSVMNDYIIVIRMYVTEWMDQIHIHYSVDDNLDIKNDGCF